MTAQNAIAHFAYTWPGMSKSSQGSVEYPSKTRGTVRFGQDLRQARLAKFRSQEEAAKALGVSRSAMAAWELGNYMPVADNFEKICDKFGKTAAKLKVKIEGDSVIPFEDLEDAQPEGADESPSILIEIVAGDLTSAKVWTSDGGAVWREPSPSKLSRMAVPKKLAGEFEIIGLRVGRDDGDLQGQAYAGHTILIRLDPDVGPGFVVAVQNEQVISVGVFRDSTGRIHPLNDPDSNFDQGAWKPCGLVVGVVRQYSESALDLALYPDGRTSL